MGTARTALAFVVALLAVVVRAGSSKTASASPSATRSSTPSPASFSGTPTASPPRSGTRTASATHSGARTVTASRSGTRTPSRTRTGTRSGTPSRTPSHSSTRHSPSRTPSHSETPTPLAFAADCRPGALRRVCTTFEPAGVDGLCPCPGTGAVARFALVVTYVVVPGLTGANRTLTGVNGSVPGPAIVVDEGAWVVVDVTNALDVPTVVHWHGQLLVGTPFADGVPGVTQCLIPPGGALQYTFRAALPGTYWYHGHFREQYVEGLYGPLIVRPAAPEPEPYDADITLMIMDYYDTPAHDLLGYFLSPASGGLEPVPNATVVNGAFSGELALAASRSQTLRLRLIAANALRMFSVAVDGLPLRVIEVDATPVLPFVVSSVTLNVAQRVSVLVDLSLLPPGTDAVWLRVTDMPMGANGSFGGCVGDCFRRRRALQHAHGGAAAPAFSPPPNFTAAADPTTERFLAWIHVDGGPPAPPAYDPDAPPPPLPPGVAPAPDNNLLDARPRTPMAAPFATKTMLLTLSFGTDPATGVNVGYFNGQSVPHNMGAPVPALVQFLTGTAPAPAYLRPTNGLRNTVFFDEKSYYYVDAGSVVDVTIVNTDSGAHPVHVHGHVFWVVSSSDNPGAAGAYADNYARRDVVAVPGFGTVTIRLVADNIGAWLLHCHIDWHMAAGLVVTLVEGGDALAASNIAASLPEGFLTQCAAGLAATAGHADGHAAHQPPHVRA